MSDPRVSILLPVRDGGAWLEVACRSVLDCEAEVELLVVDDGSTDGGVSALRAGLGGDRRLRILSQPPSGIVAALNRGLEAARAPLIARMDGDDLSLPGRIDVQLARWRAEGEDPRLGVACGVEPFRDDGAIGAGMARYCRWLNGLLTPADHWRQRLIESPLCHPTVLLATETLRGLGGYRPGPFPEDYDLWLRAMEAGVRFCKVDEVLFRWRDHGQRLTRTDPRYRPEAFGLLKLDHIERTWLGPRGIDAVQICGGGRDAKRWCDLLAGVGVRVERVFDVHPGRIGQTIRGHVPVLDHALMGAHLDLPILVAIARDGGRERLRAELNGHGLREGEDWFCVQ